MTEYAISGGLIMSVCLAAVIVVALVADAIKGRSRAELAAKATALEVMTAERDYWRTRAERLTDAALVRVGAVHQPTMEVPPPRDRVQTAQSMLTAALSVQEIDVKRGKDS